MQPVSRDSPCILGFSSSSSKSCLQTAGEAAIEPGWRKPGDGDNQFLSWPLTGWEDNCSLTQGGAVVSIVRNCNLAGYITAIKDAGGKKGKNTLPSCPPTS